MKSVGELIKEARIRKKISYQRLEETTRIKKEFIKAIEKEDWNSLPEYPVVAGFMKNIAEALQIDRNLALAFLRRDYPPKDVRINPKPDLSRDSFFSPKLTFFLGVIIGVSVIFVYLLLQYWSFISPPKLTVNSPGEGQEVFETSLTVSGKTDSDATVRVNNQPVLVSEDGSFSARIDIFEGTHEIVVVAKSRSGKETVVRRKIIPKLGG